MKTIHYLALLAFAGSAFAGVTTRQVNQSSEFGSCRNRHFHCAFAKDAGTPGAYYHSNLARNAVIVINDTPDFMTFFVYSGDMPGSNDINDMIRIGANVYQVVVSPYQTSFLDQRGRCYWVGSKQGRWGIDSMQRRIVPL